MVREFKPHVGLCADSSEPGACFGFCVSLSLSAPPPLTLCLSLSLKRRKNVKKIIKKKSSGRSHRSYLGLRTLHWKTTLPSLTREFIHLCWNRLPVLRGSLWLPVYCSHSFNCWEVLSHTVTSTLWSLFCSLNKYYLHLFPHGSPSDT